MTIEEYKQLFKPSMARINWDEVSTKTHYVRSTIITSRSVLGKTRLIWTDGEMGDGGKHYRIDQIARDMSRLGARWRARIFEIAHDFEVDEQHVSLTLPFRENIAMDGNHRLMALYISGIQFSVNTCDLQRRFPRG